MMKYFRNDKGVATGIALIIAMLTVLIVIVILAKISLERGCEGYLERAATADTIELAKTQLEIAVSYIEQRGWTKGYTSVLYKTPDEDVGFWYANIKTALKDLDDISLKSTKLEKSNVLMKLRGTLLDNGEVRVPKGIYVYPFNKLLAYGSILLIICIIAMSDNETGEISAHTVPVLLGSLALMIFFAFLSIPKQAQVELAPKKTTSVPHLEQLALLPGEELDIFVPTREYLGYLSGVCENNIMDEGKIECRRKLGEIRRGYNDITSRVNPLYGRPQFTEPELHYLRWAEGKTMELLRGFEYWFVKA